MKKLFLSSFATMGLFVFAASPTFAKDKAGKEITVTGEGKCAKCSLKESATCQNVIEVEKGKKKTIYYLEQNEVSKSFHDNICKEAKKVTATGTVKKVDGKLGLTASKLALAK